MNCLYLDIFSGLSGDMFIGALLDLGVDPRRLETELSKLDLPGYHLHHARQTRGAIAGTKFDVHLSEHGHHDHGGHEHHGHSHSHEAEHSHGHEHEEHQAHSHPSQPSHHAHRTFADIKSLIQESTLSPWTREKSIAVFLRLAQAEAKIHGQSVEKVHFHEVGAIDSIVDIVGACICLEALGCPRVLAGTVIDGTGTVHCAHGNFPLPAPATLEVLAARGIPVRQCDEPGEMVTPTGAALLAEFVENFGPMQNLVPQKIGYGLGSRENKTRPNVVRAILGEQAAKDSAGWEIDTVTVLETNLDDINSEILGAVLEKALAAGALDVFFTPIQMKKSRPAVMLSVLCAQHEADALTELLLRETTAFGVRRSTAERRKLPREFVQVATPFGEVTVKIGKLGRRVLQIAPEFESCKKVADASKVPLKQVYEAAVKAVAL